MKKPIFLDKIDLPVNNSKHSMVNLHMCTHAHVMYLEKMLKVRFTSGYTCVNIPKNTTKFSDHTPKISADIYMYQKFTAEVLDHTQKFCGKFLAHI